MNHFAHLSMTLTEFEVSELLSKADGNGDADYLTAARKELKELEDELCERQLSPSDQISLHIRLSNLDRKVNGDDFDWFARQARMWRILPDVFTGF